MVIKLSELKREILKLERENFVYVADLEQSFDHLDRKFDDQNELRDYMNYRKTEVLELSQCEIGEIMNCLFLSKRYDIRGSFPRGLQIKIANQLTPGQRKKWLKATGVKKTELAKIRNEIKINQKIKSERKRNVKKVQKKVNLLKSRKLNL